MLKIEPNHILRKGFFVTAIGSRPRPVHATAKPESNSHPKVPITPDRK
jgi:hypothetical protein